MKCVACGHTRLPFRLRNTYERVREALTGATASCHECGPKVGAVEILMARDGGDRPTISDRPTRAGEATDLDELDPIRPV